jgi:3-deoxy-D-manno-octulosonic-acid transferase
VKTHRTVVEALTLGLYSATLRLLTPAVLLRYWWRGRVEPTYRMAMCERLGRYAEVAPTGMVWLHAVSLGETRAAAALIHALRTLLPHMRLLLTHGTATGRDAGRALLREGDQQAWLPLDTPGATLRFFTHFRPAVGVLMETELWPNLLQAAQRNNVPMVLANARLSEKSRRKGERFAALLRPALQTLRLVLAQTEDDARRLRDSGAADVAVAGNLKFDMTPDAGQLARGRSWREALPRSIVLAASTREGEEAPLLAAWAALTAPRPLLLLVPRHPQRFDEVAQLVRSSGLTLLRRSAWADAPGGEAHAADVWLGDTMGEMATYYAAAHVALLGGSFAPLGGQNLIEAAACGCPVVMGPHTFNFADAAELSLQAGAALRVADLAAGVACAVERVGAAELADWSARASAFAAAHGGAAARMAGAIGALVASRPGANRAG